jgi:hypothetical protein
MCETQLVNARECLRYILLDFGNNGTVSYRCYHRYYPPQLRHLVGAKERGNCVRMPFLLRVSVA